MSLNWNIEKCNLDKDWQEKNWHLIESMIWLTMCIDIGEIKADNLGVVEYRLRYFSKVTSRNLDEVIAILPKLVGLNTNVFNTADRAFAKRMADVLDKEVQSDMRYYQAEKTNEV